MTVTLRLKVYCPVNTTPLIPAADHATASNFDAVPYAIGNNRTFLNFIQLCFTFIYATVTERGTKICPSPGGRYSGTRLSVRATCVHV